MDRQDELNSRILERINISNNLNVRYDPRSISTKYTLPNTISNLNNFSDVHKFGSFNDFSDKIGDESILRNQTCPLQHCSDNVYIPSKNSDLYKYEINNNPDNPNNNVGQLFPGLFRNSIFSNIDNKNNLILEEKDFSTKELFNNDTRQQLKNS